MARFRITIDCSNGDSDGLLQLGFGLRCVDELRAYGVTVDKAEMESLSAHTMSGKPMVENLLEKL